MALQLLLTTSLENSSPWMGNFHCFFNAKMPHLGLKVVSYDTFTASFDPQVYLFQADFPLRDPTGLL